jgi:gliding motility-associated-like protein
MKKNTLLLFLFCCANCFAQFSKTHYIPPLSASQDVVPEEQFLYLSTPSLTPVNFRIIKLGGAVVEGTVSRDVPYIYSIGTGSVTQLNVARSLVNTVLSNKGYIVEADDLIYVTVRVIAGDGNQAGELVSKGLAALGTQFRIGAFVNALVPNYSSTQYTFVSILATENNTVVNFSDIKPGVVLINNIPAGNTPTNIILNSGQSFVMAVEGPNNANRDGLIGSLITSDKPIAVNCGSFGGSNGQMNNLDLGFDQIVSAERTGKDYIFIRSTGFDEVERILLVAHEDNTEVYLNGDATPTFTMNAGEYIAMLGNTYNANGNLYVRTSKNVFAYQSIGDDSRADQANQELFFVPPLSCETPHVIDNIPALDKIGTRTFSGRVTIITQSGSTLNFVIDGSPTTFLDLPPNVIVDGPTSVAGNPNYVTYTITGLSGNVSVFSTGQLYLASYGSNGAATFGGFYSGFTFKPEIAFDRLDLAAALCIPNISLSVSPLTAFDIFQWYFNDVAIPGATASNYAPALPGYYHVSATIGACGTTLISDKIPVSSCAGNLDNDQANDNADIDNDNDGITNCTESYGSAPFNLSNPLLGSVSVGAYSNTFTGSFPTSSGTPAAIPFTGLTDGSFITETTSGKGNSVIYKMNYAQPVSISMEYVLTANAADLINSKSEFVVTVPVDKTITVLNPTNQLLIDTNYDGIYESGVTEFSSFEIRFRLNSSVPLPAGTGTFKFLSYLVNSFTFTHKNLVDTGNAKSTFRILASCVPKDSDGDGTPDQLDLDSDNDGILDVYESQGANFVAATNNDANLDGMDDAYGTGVVLADTDTDAVFDYLDLDSDNDGIYDLTESGSIAPDANNNGTIDGNPATFGANGLSSAVETAPDSGILAYTLTDTDGDGIHNYIEQDNDNDLCNDVREAGFSDPDNDGIPGSAAPPTVNANGVVTGITNGYTTPNPNYLIATPIIITSQPQNTGGSGSTCENQDAAFTIETNADVTYQWQLTTNDVNYFNISDGVVYSGTATPTLTVNNVAPVMNNYKYRVVLSKVGNVCGLISDSVTLNVNALPAVVTKTLVQCDTGANPDGITSFNLAEANTSLTNNDPNLSIEFFASLLDAQNNVNKLDNDYTNLTNPQLITVRITNNTTGCFSYSTLNLSVNLLANQSINLPEQCETSDHEDGFMIFDLTTASIPVSATQNIRYYVNETDALLEQNQIADPQHYQNLVAYTMQTLYARIESGNNCSRLYLVNIKVNPLPQIDTNTDLETHLVCVNTPTFTTILDAAILDSSSPSVYTYNWTFQGGAIPGAHASTLTVNTEGTYTVEVTDANGCSKIRTIPVVASSSAVIQDIAIADLSDYNTVVVTLASNSYGDYVYSLDHQNAFQTSNVFVNVEAGIHTVYVKDTNGCPIASQEISVLGIPPYFTPNGDGFNDTWNVKGISSRFSPGTIIHIFDRYGKFLKQIGAAGNGWDGTYNGLPMLSDDYWFVVKFENGKTIKGHFALKR